MCRGITFILSAVLFRIVPTALEISLVCGILVCDHIFCLGRNFIDWGQDVQFWLELCRYYCCHYGRIYLVHCAYDILEVRLVAPIAAEGGHSITVPMQDALPTGGKRSRQQGSYGRG